MRTLPRFTSALPLLAVAMPFLSAAVAAQSSGATGAPRTTVMVTGCLMDEGTYAQLSGLGGTAPLTRGAPVQLVIADDRENFQPATAMALTGMREQELVGYANTRIEITGVVERSRLSAPATASRDRRPGLPPSGAAGTTENGSAAHEAADLSPGAAKGATAPGGVATRDGSDARPAAQAVATIGELDRLNAQSFHATGESCEKAVRSRLASASTLPSTAPAVPAAAITPRTNSLPMPVTAVGCLINQSAEGDKPAPNSPPQLALIRAAVTARGATGTAGAVPGSVVSGSGSGTVAPAVALNDAEFSFLIDGQQPELLRLVGQRISVAGIIKEPTAPANSGRSGHALTSSDTLTVTIFRSTGEACR